MSSVRIAGRYAKSLLLIANEQNALEAIHADMQTLSSVCRTNKDFLVLLKSPVVKTDKKIAIFHAIFGATFQKISMMFLELITKKNREEHIADISRHFIRQYREQKGIKDATVTTATELTEQQRSEVEARLRTWSDSEVHVTYKEDDHLIGGIIVRLEDKEFNASIRARLQDLTRAYSDNPYVSKL